jgi:TatD DNase family protein
MIFGTFGIHPHESSVDIVTKKEIIKNINDNNKIIGVGETGLDFYYNHSDKKKQISSFEAHIGASIDLNLPLIVHSRNAEIETFEVLNKYKKYNPKILMHCFTGSYNFAQKLLSLNSYFSASGIITFKNSIELQETFKKISIDKLLIETDSPFLAPIPKRGRKNEPSFIKYTAEKLADLRKLTFDEITKITTNNFNNLFSIK